MSSGLCFPYLRNVKTAYFTETTLNDLVESRVAYLYFCFYPMVSTMTSSQPTLADVVFTVFASGLATNKVNLDGKGMLKRTLKQFGPVTSK